jgi:hypothetical protein
VNVNLNGIPVNDGSYNTLQLASLPSSETFKSHTDNALKKNSVSVNSNSFTVTVPALSTTAVLLKSATTAIVEPMQKGDKIKIFPNPASDHLFVSINSTVAEQTEISIYNHGGQKIQSSVISYDGYTPIKVNLSSFSNGLYLLSVKNSHGISTKSFTLIR